MIVGIHPEDPFCHPITQEENDDYVLVDGVQKIALFKTNNRISGKFYEDAVVQDDRFLVFRDIILSNIGQLESTSDIRDLYDFFCREWEICADIKRREEIVLSACKDYLVNGKPQKYKFKEILKLFGKTSS